jgi:hypothetical protein
VLGRRELERRRKVDLARLLSRRRGFGDRLRHRSLLERLHLRVEVPSLVAEREELVDRSDVARRFGRRLFLLVRARTCGPKSALVRHAHMLARIHALTLLE